MGFFNLFKKDKDIVSTEISGVVLQLEQLGYFKYAEEKDVAELMKEVGDGLIKYKYLYTVYSDTRPSYSKDLRHYFFDGEDLFEEGGFIDMLNDMKPFFEKTGFKLNIENHIEDWDDENDWLNHSITLNGKNYIIFRNFKGYGWDEAAQRFAEIINDQMEIQGKDERLFLSQGGNDGNAVFLTEAQFTLLEPILGSGRDRLLRVSDWCDLMNLDKNNHLQA